MNFAFEAQTYKIHNFNYILWCSVQKDDLKDTTGPGRYSQCSCQLVVEAGFVPLSPLSPGLPSLLSRIGLSVFGAFSCPSHQI